MDKRLVKKSINKNIDSELKQLNDIITHKKFIMDSAGLLCKYFIKNNNLDMALETLKVSFAHDISKSNKDEFLGFSHMITEDDKNKIKKWGIKMKRLIKNKKRKEFLIQVAPTYGKDYFKVRDPKKLEEKKDKRDYYENFKKWFTFFEKKYIINI